MADINKRAPWVTARLLEVGRATNNGANVLITDANIHEYLPEAASNYESLHNKPQINGVTLSGNMSMSDIKAVYDDTTVNWNSHIDFIPSAGAIVIYSDYAETEDGVKIPNIKIGDGLAYLIDLPFVADDLREIVMSHIISSTMHITAAERNSWNNKVTCYVEMINGQEYKIIFSKN